MNVADLSLVDIYVCPYCFWPVFFRSQDLRKTKIRYRPRVYHIPTGWYCWEDRQRALKEGRKPQEGPLRKFPKGKPTPKARRDKLRQNADRLYRRYLEDDDASPMIRFVSDQLGFKRFDVIRDLLFYLAEQKGAKHNLLVRRVLTGSSWQKFARSLKPARKA